MAMATAAAAVGEGGCGYGGKEETAVTAVTEVTMGVVTGEEELVEESAVVMAAARAAAAAAARAAFDAEGKMAKLVSGYSVILRKKKRATEMPEGARGRCAPLTHTALPARRSPLAIAARRRRCRSRI
jgi:hypothetical protein